MNVFAHVEERIRAALAAVQAAGGLPAELMVNAIDVEPVRDTQHGDLASNIAMVLGKPARAKPRDIADKLAAELKKEPGFDKVEVAGPGFLNITLAPRLWHEVVGTILEAGAEFGRSNVGDGDAANVEYVSANPTGPMHVGHCRGAVFGDALANLLAFAGYKVTREYYINDAGGQVDVLARSAYLRYREALGENIGAIPEGLYPGDYLKPVGAALAQAHGRALFGKPEGEWLADVRQAAIAAMLVQIKEDLAALSIRHDVFFSERSLTSGNRDEVAETVKELRAKGLVFEGRLEKPKGHDADDWEDREQTLFKSSQFGDDMDRPLLKSDGSYTYFASDIAYHYDKIQRGFTRMIDVLGADHAGYAKRMKAAVTAISGGEAELEVQFCQLVRLFRGGEPVRMSKRSGDLVTLREVVDEVGADAVRFMMLYRKADAPLDFDFQAVTEQSKDNPVFYVQYAHARTESVRRQALAEVPGIDLAPSALGQADLASLRDEGERMLVRQMAHWPRILDGSARSREPHRVAFYLNDLASTFHAHWNRGKELPQLRFIKPDDLDTSRGRLALVTGIGNVLRSGLTVLGVDAPREMR